jgi:hypothetical protein
MAKSTVASIAADLYEVNPAASNLYINLHEAETASEVSDALDRYDLSVSDAE